MKLNSIHQFWYGVYRLTDLVRTVEAGRPGVKFQDFVSLPTIGKGGKKGDIFRLGIILLSLAQGKLTTDTPPQVCHQLLALSKLKQFL